MNSLFGNRRNTRAAGGVVTVFPVEIGAIGRFGFHKGIMAPGLLESQQDEADDDREPEEVVADDTAVGGTVLPTKQRIENTPAAATVQLGVTAVDMPDTLSNVVRPRARAVLGCITTGGLVPGVRLEEPDASGEEAGRHKVKEASAHNEEDLQRSHGTTLVDDEADSASGSQAANCGKGDRASR